MGALDSINAKGLKVDDVVQAYDLLTAHYILNSDLVPAGTEPSGHALAELNAALTSIGYGMATHVDTLVRNHVAKTAREGRDPYDASTSRDGAKALFSAVSGAELPPSAPKAAKTTETDPEEQTMPGAPANVHTPATDSKPAVQTAGGLGSVVIAKALAGSIDAMMAQLLHGRASSIETLLRAVGEAESTVAAQSKAKAWGEAKLKSYRDGDVESAEAMEFEIPAFKPSGMTDLKAEDKNLAGVLDTLLSQATGGSIKTFAEIVAALNEAETLAGKKAAELRQLSRDVKAAAPKKKISVSAGGDSGSDDASFMPFDCEIVMRKASEVFTDAFGMSSPILDFEIPTIEWAEKHPDVPAADASFRFYAPVLADALDSLVNNEICWLYGESGCGKSEFWMQVAARIGFPVFRLNMDSHLSRADLVGTNRLLPGANGQPEMRFVEGLVPRAMRVPSITLIDEMDLGDPEVMPVLQPVLEGHGIRLLEDGGRYVAPHEWARIAVTANTIGLGSQNMMYINAHEQSAATRDRIARYVEMPYLPPDKELEVVMARVPEAVEDFARKVIQLAGKVRDGYRLSEIHQVFSTRTVLRAVRRHAKFAPLYGDEDKAIHTTLEVTVLNRCDPHSRSVVKGLIDNIF